MSNKIKTSIYIISNSRRNW